jgi:hypothetical protein
MTPARNTPAFVRSQRRRYSGATLCECMTNVKITTGHPAILNCLQELGYGN